MKMRGDLWALPINRLCSSTVATVGVDHFPSGGIVQLITAPNPFQLATAIQFTLSARENVSVGIYDIAGRMIRRIDSGAQGPGNVSVQWDGRDTHGDQVVAGVYLVKLSIGQHTRLGRVIRIR